MIVIETLYSQFKLFIFLWQVMIELHRQKINDFLFNMAGYGAPVGGYGGQATKGNGILCSYDI